MAEFNNLELPQDVHIVKNFYINRVKAMCEFFEVCGEMDVNGVKKNLNKAIKCIDSDTRLQADDKVVIFKRIRSFNIPNLNFPNGLPLDD